MRARAPWIATLAVACAGLAAELGDFLLGAPPKLVELFSLSYEVNVPTWYASALLLLCAERLLRLAPTETHPRLFGVLGVTFAAMSLDEAIEIHEHLGGLVEGHGVLYFSWVVPAGIFVLVYGASMWPLLRDLDPATRRRFVISGAVYVGGALLMELPLGWWTEQHGDQNLVYGLLDFVEESMELVGATLFYVTLDQRPSARTAS